MKPAPPSILRALLVLTHLLCAASVLAAPPAKAPAGPPRLVIFDLVFGEGAKDLGEPGGLTEIVFTHMARTLEDRAIMVPRSEVAAEIRAAGEASGPCEMKCRQKVAGRLGAMLVVAGALERKESGYAGTIELVRGKGGARVGSVDIAGKDRAGVEDKLLEAATELAELVGKAAATPDKPSKKKGK